MVLLSFDGASRGNPGPAAYGFVIVDDSGVILQSGSGYLGEETCNYAEYMGLYKGILCCAHCGYINVSVLGDSQLVINQMNGVYMVRSVSLREVYDKIRGVIDCMDMHVTFEWNKRDSVWSKKCDLLCNQMLDSMK